LLRCSPGYACIAEHRQRGASTPLVLTLFRKRWSGCRLLAGLEKAEMKRRGRGGKDAESEEEIGIAGQA
ncbi:MAG: hypothetical protein V3T83_04670, partial [Acidobacteriota bacterium]